MKYTEETAAKIRERFDVPLSTVRVWKTRGRIPKKFMDPDYEHNPEMITPLQLARVRKVLQNDKLNLSKLADNSDINRYKLNDVKKGKSSLSKSQYASLKRRLLELRNEAKAVSGIDKATDKNLEQIREYLNKNSDLVVSVLYSKRWLDFKNGLKVAINQDDMQIFRDRTPVLVLELQV